MSAATVTRAQYATFEQHPSVVNDFSIVVATVNGSGSQTANSILLRAIFKMGIPVSGKHVVPSNISGLPTWYTLRLSKDGYVARREQNEILVAFNEQTAVADLAALPTGGVCCYPAEFRFAHTRDDVIYYAVPAQEIIKATGSDPKLRDYLASMVYVGALTELLGIDRDALKAAIGAHPNLSGKPRTIDLNCGVVETAANWIRDDLAKLDPYRVERLQATDELILIDGNTAGALGAIFGGVSVAAWYPITPSTSLIDALTAYLPQLRQDADGKATYAVVQAEDELAAAGIVFGAGWAGARAMTATSGPGLSLMAEFAGLGFFAELPGVIWDIQRMGPSTGLPTRVSQGDVLKAYFLGHGDTRHVCLLPGSPAECFAFGWQAFDLAERLQTPVFVLSDLDLGMNTWMSAAFTYPDIPMDRGRSLRPRISRASAGSSALRT